MKRLSVLLIIVGNLFMKTAAQQNWAAVPCFELRKVDAIGVMYVDLAHNELILNSEASYMICNHTYKAIFAYNGNTFHDLDVGVETHDYLNPYTGNFLLNGVEAYNNKAIIIGAFLSVGSNTLYSKSIAQWDGAKWSTFPHPFWNNTPSWTTGGAFHKLLADNGKLWMFGAYDSTGNSFTSKIVRFDGTTFTPIPSLPITNPSAITEAIIYKNKLVVAGGFYDNLNFNFSSLAQFDGTNWLPVGNGVQGGLSAVQTVAIYNDTLYIGGAFPKSAGNAGNYLMKWDGNKLTDAGFSDIFVGYGAIWKLLPYKNRLYAFGAFSYCANQKAFGVAYYENGKWTVPQDSIDNYAVYDAAVYNDEIYIGGGFKSINGDTTLSKFVKLMCPDFDMATGCLSGIKELSNQLDVKVFPNPTKNKLNIELEDQQKTSVLITNTLGQTVFSKSEIKKEIDISILPVGVYYLRLQNKTSFKVLKILKE